MKQVFSPEDVSPCCYWIDTLISTASIDYDALKISMCVYWDANSIYMWNCNRRCFIKAISATPKSLADQFVWIPEEDFEKNKSRYLSILKEPLEIINSTQTKEGFEILYKLNEIDF